MSEPGKPVLSVEGLSVAFDGAPVVRDVTLDLVAGEILCLVGPSGTGKSVMARAVLRLDEAARVTGGRVAVDGRDVTRAGGRTLRRLRGAEIGMIFQEPVAALDPVRRIGAQLRETLALDGRNGRAEAEGWLVRVGLGREVMAAYPHELSGGMCQRVMIALALARRPRVLIADEPTTALDAVTQAGILALLDRLKREEGLAILLITHDAQVARAVGDRVAHMRNGRIERIVPVADDAGPDPARGPFRRPARDREAVLELRGLGVSHGAGPPALHDVTLTVRRGEMLALVGQSGSGKTTLGRAALRLEGRAGMAGQIALEGRDITHLEGGALRAVRARMQMVFQDPMQSLDARRSVGRQIGDSLRNFGVPRAEVAHRVTAIAEQMGLDPALLSRRPGGLSGGQRQRAALARALVLDPALLVADEAFAALDPEMRERMAGLLIEAQEVRDLACLFISHDIAQVARIAHRIAVLWRGRVVEIGPAEAVMTRPAHPYTRALIAASRGKVMALPHAPEEGAALGEIAPGHYVLARESA
ncbi:ABC transporter ATP-binding protein [Roseovarius sp. SCSIO 43702]|uniref:ATP-binding cassette domain-containing protein n=1 Tax=Roseovarius sp. SCSIO 43702 TaxID=2823043 RepID=UPI001C72D841|nr:ABC transporter ATP-binding protein [Roseovarius sp. SCSIO 43702]QYX58189.1 ABC transporter ATP-binding protein [Roseovarius sp. SCSIO 43702]